MRSKYSFQQYGLASETMLLDPRQRPRSTRMQQRILICFFFRRLFACRRLSCQSLPMRYHDFRARLIWKRRPQNSQLYFPRKCIALRASVRRWQDHSLSSLLACVCCQLSRCFLEGASGYTQTSDLIKPATHRTKIIQMRNFQSSRKWQ